LHWRLRSCPLSSLHAYSYVIPYTCGILGLQGSQIRHQVVQRDQALRSWWLKLRSRRQAARKACRSWVAIHFTLAQAPRAWVTYQPRKDTEWFVMSPLEWRRLRQDNNYTPLCTPNFVSCACLRTHRRPIHAAFKFGGICSSMRLSAIHACKRDAMFDGSLREHLVRRAEFGHTRSARVPCRGSAIKRFLQHGAGSYAAGSR